MDKEEFKTEILETLKSKGWNTDNVGYIDLINDILDTESIKKLFIPVVSQCNEQVCTLHRYCEYQSGLGRCSYLSQCDYKKQTCG